MGRRKQAWRGGRRGKSEHQKKAQGWEVDSLPDTGPWGQLPTCAAFFPKQGMKSTIVTEEIKIRDHRNCGCPPGHHHTHILAPGGELSKHFISPTYRGQGSYWTQMGTQRYSNLLPSGSMRKQSRLNPQSQGRGVRSTRACNSGGFRKSKFYTQDCCWSLTSLCLSFLVSDVWILVSNGPFPPWHGLAIGHFSLVRMVEG